jgi:hypothetical protein
MYSYRRRCGFAIEAGHAQLRKDCFSRPPGEAQRNSPAGRLVTLLTMELDRVERLVEELKPIQKWDAASGMTSRSEAIDGFYQDFVSR